jgi:hypothetical protein
MSDLIPICKNGNAQLSDNFVESEFYSKSEDAPDCHTISSKLIQAVQLVRTVYGMPICITSTYRTALGNMLVGSSPTSRHRTPEAAVDFKACNEAQNDELIGQLYAEFREQGEVYQTLRSLGINGFGFYDGFIHFDVRPDFAYWDETSGKFGDIDLDGKKKNFLARFFSQLGGEDGLKDYRNELLILIVSLIVLIIVGVVQRKRK